MPGQTCARCGEQIASYHNLHTAWRGKRYEYGTHYHKWCWELVKVGRSIKAHLDRDEEHHHALFEIAQCLLIGDAPWEDK